MEDRCVPWDVRWWNPIESDVGISLTPTWDRDREVEALGRWEGVFKVRSFGQPQPSRQVWRADSRRTCEFRSFTRN
jgi:hypothetical protein